MVALLDPHTGGEDTGQQVGAWGRAEFSADDGQLGWSFAWFVLQFIVHGSQVARQGGVNDASFLQKGVGGRQQAGKVSAGQHVIGALHGQDVGGGGVRGQAVAQLCHALSETILVGGQPGGVGIRVAQVEQEHLVAIGGAPAEFCRQVTDAAPHAGRVNVKAAQDLRHLPNVAKRVRDVADAHPCLRAKATAHSLAYQQVAHRCLWADQEFVGQDVPWPDDQSPSMDVVAELLLSFGTELQVVLEHDGLPVEHKVTVVRVSVQQCQELIDQFDQTKAELLESQIPLAVSVCV